MCSPLARYVCQIGSSQTLEVRWIIIHTLQCVWKFRKFWHNYEKISAQYVHTQCGKTWNSLSLKKKIRQINYLVISLVKPLLSRNFCQKSVRENFRNFHTLPLLLWIQNISWNRWLEYITLTKFLLKITWNLIILLKFVKNFCSHCKLWKWGSSLNPLWWR